MSRLINNTYEILNVVGKGGMSAVYKARHVRLNTIWAVKEVYKNKDENIDLLAETNILKRLNHPSLPRIIDIFEDDNSVYIVEDFVTGSSLQQVIEQEKVIDEQRVRSWFKTLAEVLIYLHTQEPHPIIYRDMKPANIMLQSDQTLKLIDFGIAREYKPESNTDTTVIGTRGYAAPEQYGKTQSDARTDIYSLGVTMYYLATGKSPYQPPYTFVPARQLNPNLSAGMETILSKCIQTEPENRYQSAAELLDDLNHIDKYDEEFIRVRKTIQRRRILLACLYTIGAALVTAGFFVNRSECDQDYLSMVTQSKTESYEEATATLHRAQQLLPKRDEAYEAEAALIYKNGLYKQAADYIKELENSGIITLQENPNVYSILASSYFEQNDYEAASQLYEKLSGINTAFTVQNQIGYAVCAGRMGDLEKAQKIIDSLKGSANETELAYLEGEIAYLNKDYIQAAEKFSEVTESNSDSDLLKRAYVSLAETYRDSAKLASSDPQHIENAYSLAVDTIETSMRQFDLSGNAALWEMLGYAYYNRAAYEKNNDTEDILKSVDAYRKALTLGVQKDYLYVNIFIAYQTVGKYPEAENVLEEMRSIYPNSYQPYMYHSFLLIMMENQKPESERNYQKAYEEYQKAKESASSSESNEQMQQLESLIKQLKDGGWLQ